MRVTTVAAVVVVVVVVNAVYIGWYILALLLYTVHEAHAHL